MNTIKPEFDKFYFGDDDFLNLSCTVFDLFFPSRSTVYRELFDDSFDRSEKSIPITKVPINTNLYQSQVEEQSPRKVVVVKKHNPEQKKNTDKYTFYENNIKKEINEYFSFRNKLQSTTGEYTFIVARSIIEHLLKLAIYLDYRFNNTDELISLTPGDKIKSESFKNCFPSNILNILGEIIRTGNKVAHESADFNYTDKDIEETKKITESLCNWFELSYPQIKETNA